MNDRWVWSTALLLMAGAWMGSLEVRSEAQEAAEPATAETATAATSPYNSEPSVNFLSGETLPNPDSVASTEAEMKPYTEEMPGVKFDMVKIPGGKFLMGSTEAEQKAVIAAIEKLGYDDAERDRLIELVRSEGPQHEVAVEPFWMATCEVPWDQYEVWYTRLDVERRQGAPGTPLDQVADLIMKPTPPYYTFGKEPNRPTVCISQYAAAMYCKWLTAKTGRYYRLPTEAEWEYACRAGTTTAYSYGSNSAKQLGDYAVFTGNATEDEKGEFLGSKKPNAWGLYDMHGNASEWCIDFWYVDAYQRAVDGDQSVTPFAKPELKRSGLPKEYPYVARGGSYRSEAVFCRSASRDADYKPEGQFTNKWRERDPQIPPSIWWLTDAPFVGFRVVRPLRTPTAEEATIMEPNPDVWKKYREAQGGRQSS